MALDVARARVEPAQAGLGREQLAEIQRSRLVGAAVAVLDELGYEHATVARITARAGVSRRTFYELFVNREACIAAIVQEGALRFERALDSEELRGLNWRERIRMGLWELLCLLEREPALARVLLVHSACGSGEVQRTREAQIARLVALVDAGCPPARSRAQYDELTAEGIVGAALAILRTRVLDGRGVSPRELYGQLCAMIVLPYLGAAAARREHARPAPRPLSPMARKNGVLGADPLAALPMRMTYRTVRVLEGVGRRPGSSNRQAGEYAGIPDQGQISKLLSRLERLGLLANTSAGHSRGERNAWTLTPLGDSIVRAIGARVVQDVGREHAA